MRSTLPLIVLALSTSACASPDHASDARGPANAKTIAELICAEPRNRVDKVNQQQCEAYYADAYGDGTVCKGLSVAGCMFTIRQLELSLLLPKFKPAQP